MVEIGTETGIEVEVVAVVAAILPTVRTLARDPAAVVVVAAETKKSSCLKRQELH